MRPTIEYGCAHWVLHSKFEINDKKKIIKPSSYNIVLDSCENRYVDNEVAWYFNILYNFTKLDSTDLFIVNMRYNH